MLSWAFDFIPSGLASPSLPPYLFLSFRLLRPAHLVAGAAKDWLDSSVFMEGFQFSLQEGGGEE